MFDAFQEAMSNTLRVMATGLRIPVMVLLVILAALTLFLLGTLIVEIFMEHRHLTEEMPGMVDKIEGATKENLPAVIGESRLLLRQKDALLELTKHPQLTPLMRESLAIRLIAQERDYYDGRTRRTDLIARIGPMLGLMGTLIPLGPGIIALGQGDTYTLSTSLLMAFDTTVAGLACAAVALVISNVRKRWYRNYMSMLETLMECTLEAENSYGKEAAKATPATPGPAAPQMQALRPEAPAVEPAAEPAEEIPVEEAAGPAEEIPVEEVAEPAPEDDAEARKAELIAVYKGAYTEALRGGVSKEEAVARAREEAERFLAARDGKEAVL